MSDYLIINGSVLTMDEQETIYSPGWVEVSGSTISALGEGVPPANVTAKAERVLDAANMAVLPGLVNGHTHLSQTFMRGLADDKPLLQWLKQIMWPMQAAMSVEDMRLASLLGLAENLRCGATTVVQHHKITQSRLHLDATACAAELLGLRMLLARGWVDLGSGAEPPDAIINDMEYLHDRWHMAADGRITIGFGPLTPWRCSDATIRRTVALAREWGVPTHIHVAEARDEIEMLRQRTGMRHVEWLHSLGALGPETQLVHSVWIDDSELDWIAQSGAVVVHCPVSNMYLASGVAPVRKMLDRGITVALGTDGSASENSQDLLEAVKIAVLLAKVTTGDATVLRPVDALHMATRNGARLLGRDDIGRLVPQARADITLVNLNTSRSMPVHDPQSALVYNASGPDVHTVMVDGRILVDGGRLTMLDETALLEECRQAARRLVQRAGVVR